MSEEKYSVWFAKRRESAVMDGAKEHILKIVDTCEELDNAVQAVVSGENEKAKQAIARLYIDEKAADNIEVRLNEDLAKGDLPSKEREDFMHLIKRIDHIADWSKSAARNIEVIIDAEIDVPDKIWKYMKVLASRVLDAAKEVKMCIEFIGEDDEQFMVHQRNTQRIEHEIDDLYFKVKKDLMLSMSLDPRVMFVMRDIIHAMENAADNCKGAVDLMHIILTANK